MEPDTEFTPNPNNPWPNTEPPLPGIKEVSQDPDLVVEDDDEEETE